MNILLAEDRPIIQMLNHSMMTGFGYDYDMASNGEEAVEYARRNEGQYDLCIMDVEMPKMNGIEATRIIRQEMKYIPILALTSNSDYKWACLDAGMDEFLEKPCLPPELLVKIKELTVKSYLLDADNDCIAIKQVMPMNSDELKELRELDKKGLTKFSLLDTNHKFIVHKNLQNKLSHDFISKEKSLSEFLDRSPDSPGIVHVYASNLHANKRYILPELLEQLVSEEDEEMQKHVSRSEYPENGEGK